MTEPRVQLIPASLVLLGCSSSVGSRGTEQLLTDAGFVTKMADTPERRAHLAKLPAYKMIPMTREDGTKRYVYADPNNQRALVGDEGAYQTYVKRNRVAHQQAIVAQNKLPVWMY